MYGLSSTAAIQNAIYAKFLEAFFGESKKRKVAYYIVKNTTLFGGYALDSVGSKFSLGSLGSSISNFASGIGRDFIDVKHKDTILIFDDLERCKVDILEAMGFLNNLCENESYRVIVIANEDRILKEENSIKKAIDVQTSVHAMFGEKKTDQKSNNRNRTDEMNDLIGYYDSIRDFDAEAVTYETTKEKLFGLIIRYHTEIEDAFENIVEKSIKSDDIRRVLNEHRNLYIDAYKQEFEKNLRTLISALIATEFFFREIDKHNSEEAVEYKNTYTEEKNKVINYILCSTVRHAFGEDEVNWEDSRYGNINLNRPFMGKRIIFGYRFVDDYWKALYVTEKEIYEDFYNSVKDIIDRRLDKEEEEKHKNLALFTLNEWYLYDDDTVCELISKMREELEMKKYYPYEFKDIIVSLMRINNAQFGMSVKLQEYGNDSNAVYEPTEDMELEAIKADSKAEIVFKDAYNPWNSIDIKSYVDLMLKYFEDSHFEIDRQTLRMLSDDKVFAQEYKYYIKPLLSKIDEKEVKNLKKTDDGQDVFLKWDDALLEFCRNHKNDYMERRSFLSLYDDIDKKIETANSKELFSFGDAVNVVYSFSNLRDVFREDFSTVSKIYLLLKEDRESGRQLTNKTKSRTKEIALRRLEIDFHKYFKALMAPNEAPDVDEVGVDDGQKGKNS